MQASLTRLFVSRDLFLLPLQVRSDLISMLIRKGMCTCPPGRNSQNTGPETQVELKYRERRQGDKELLTHSRDPELPSDQFFTSSCHVHGR
jgi:hypothetical protein